VSHLNLCILYSVTPQFVHTVQCLTSICAYCTVSHLNLCILYSATPQFVHTVQWLTSICAYCSVSPQFVHTVQCHTSICATKQTYRFRKNFEAVKNSTNNSGDLKKTGLNDLSLQLPQLMVKCYVFRTPFKCRILWKVTMCPRYILHFCWDTSLGSADLAVNTYEKQSSRWNW